MEHHWCLFQCGWQAHTNSAERLPYTDWLGGLQIAARVRSHILRTLPDVSEVLVHVDVEFGA